MSKLKSNFFAFITLVILLGGSYALLRVAKGILKGAYTIMEREVKSGFYIAFLYGDVEAQVGGVWKPVNEGDVLPGGSKIRVKNHSSVTMLVKKSRITAKGGTSLFLKDEWNVLVEEGAIEAEIGLIMRIHGPKAGVFVDTNDGKFCFLSHRDVFATELKKGWMVLSIGDWKRKMIGREFISYIPEELRTRRMRKEKLKLEVDMPEDTKINRKVVQVTGETSLNALVEINREFKLDGKVEEEYRRIILPFPSGKFFSEVPLYEGANDISIMAFDACGYRKMVRLPTIYVDTKPPKAEKIIIKPLW